MAVVNLLSKQITDRDATPPVLDNSNIVKGPVFASVGKVAIGTADSATSTYRFCSVPSNARILGAKISASAAIGADTACTLDLFDTTANGGAVVKAGFFNADIDLNASQASALEVGETLSGANTNFASNGEKMIWEVLGLSTDPNKMYDVVMSSTVNNATTGADAKLTVTYTL